MDGVLLVDKPRGMSSHDVVARVRAALAGCSQRDQGAERRSPPADRGPRRSSIGRPKVGHAGTLDPFATGLLVVLVGRATKQQRAFMALPKRYETVARLGAISSSGDPEGEIQLTGRLPADPLALPVGEVRQRPPIYSAVKIRGERAYRRARRGELVEMPERVVTVMRFDQLWREAPDPSAGGTARAAFTIECSSGTYVRSLIADLGDAYCEELRRTAIGPFSVTDALAPPAFGERWSEPPVIALDAALAAVERFVTQGS